MGPAVDSCRTPFEKSGGLEFGSLRREVLQGSGGYKLRVFVAKIK